MKEKFGYVFQFNGYVDDRCEPVVADFSAENLNDARRQAVDWLRAKYHYKMAVLVETEILRIAKYPYGEVLFDKDVNCRH